MPCGARKSLMPFFTPCSVSYVAPQTRRALQGVLAPVQEALVAARGAQRGEVVGETSDRGRVGAPVVVDDDDQRRVWSAAMLFRASQAMPPVRAPSPMTATMCGRLARQDAARAMPSAQDSEDDAWEFSTMSCSDSARPDSRTCRPACAAREVVAAGEELVHVGLVAGVEHDVVRGELKTRCRAMVSSTTPRLGPRCPPVLDTGSTRNSRISPARAVPAGRG